MAPTSSTVRIGAEIHEDANQPLDECVEVALSWTFNAMNNAAYPMSSRRRHSHSHRGFAPRAQP